MSITKITYDRITYLVLVVRVQMTITGNRNVADPLEEVCVIPICIKDVSNESYNEHACMLSKSGIYYEISDYDVKMANKAMSDFLKELNDTTEPFIKFTDIKNKTECIYPKCQVMSVMAGYYFTRKRKYA